MQPQAFLWHITHFGVVGALASVRILTTWSWQPAQARWNACWFVRVMMAVEFSLLICGISGTSVGFSSLRTWQLRQAETFVSGALASRSAVSVVVRSGG